MSYHHEIKTNSRNTGESSAILLETVVQKLFLITLSVFMMSCSSVFVVPLEEYEYFDAKQYSLRSIEAPKISFIFSNDSAKACEKLMGRLEINKKYLGCANWQKSEGTCTVFVPYFVQNVILGHEIRHCFEGAFH
jgi:hypothetical protein